MVMNSGKKKKKKPFLIHCSKISCGIRQMREEDSEKSIMPKKGVGICMKNCKSSCKINC